MDISCAFPPGRDTPELVELAEQLGYRRAWLYDSPALYADIWATLARCADRTQRIGLGTAVLVPGVRHVMTTAAATATIEAIAPGRLALAVGSGFTGRFVLGQRPHPWAEVRAYVEALRALLRGEEVEYDGRVVKMIHPHGLVADRPVDVPILIGAQGPKGLEVARDVGDGVFSASALLVHSDFAWSAALGFGTVLSDDERPDAPSVLARVGPVTTAGFHFLYEHGSTGGFSLETLPGGDEWKAAIDAIPPDRRHLALHEGHMVAVPERDQRLVSGDMVAGLTITGTVDELGGRLAVLGSQGLTELAFQPPASDPHRDLRLFAEAAGL